MMPERVSRELLPRCLDAVRGLRAERAGGTPSVPFGDRDVLAEHGERRQDAEGRDSGRARDTHGTQRRSTNGVRDGVRIHCHAAQRTAT